MLDDLNIKGTVDAAADDGYQQETHLVDTAFPKAAIGNDVAEVADIVSPADGFCPKHGVESCNRREVQDHSKSETQSADAVDALERATSIIQNVMATDTTFLQRRIDECRRTEVCGFRAGQAVKRRWR